MNLNHIQVLLIDDDEDDFANMRAVLSEISGSSFQLTWADSYRAGIAKLGERPFDVCLLDYRLGELTGLDLLREARELGVTAPMILLTGHGDFDLDIKAMQSGAADYLVKGQINAPLLERSIRYSMKQALDLAELTEQRENFKVLFNSTFEGIAVHRQGLIVDANAALGDIFARTPAEMLFTPISKYMRADHAKAINEQIAAGKDVQSEAVGLRSDGREIFLGLSSRKVTLKGDTVSLMAIRDLTEPKQLEAQILQQDRLASLGLLASSLAHEIGTPLGVIRGRAEMLSKSSDEKVKSTMELITSQIDRISKLVSSLLHIARGSKSENVADVSLASVVGDVANLMSHELERKNIALKTDTPPGLCVRGEAGPLGQVFLNLMVNSVFAIEEARAAGRLEAHEISVSATQSGDSVEICVRDTGCGISEENLRNLFKPFFTTKEIGVGTGLGLATSYKIVQSWGGSITVESQVNAGTTFRIGLRARR